MIRSVAAIAIADAATIAIVAGNLPAYACSGQGMAATTAESPSVPPPSKAPSRPSHDGSRSSGGESIVYADEQLQYLEARLRALLGSALRDAGSTVPKVQSLCM
jgi:hypothetical protein